MRVENRSVEYGGRTTHLALTLIIQSLPSPPSLLTMPAAPTITSKASMPMLSPTSSAARPFMRKLLNTEVNHWEVEWTQEAVNVERGEESEEAWGRGGGLGREERSDDRILHSTITNNLGRRGITAYA